MSLTIHRAARAEPLAHRLAEVLSEPLDDPFDRDVVVVAAPGVERWLAQTLSHRLGTDSGSDPMRGGICAGIEFVRPHHLLGEITGRSREDAWSPARLAWAIHDVLSGALDEPWLDVVARHVGRGLPAPERDLRRRRLHSTARRTARLLHGYAVQRPAMVQDWRAGHDTDGDGAALPHQCRWQAELFRRLEARLDDPAPDVRLATAAAAWGSGQAPEDVPVRLPRRLSLFGHTRLPWGEVQVLAALARERDVHLWLPHPSRRRWDERAGHPAPAALPAARDAATSARGEGNRLLASCARDADELQVVLALAAAGAGTALDVDHVDATSAVTGGAAGPEPDGGATLLARVQADLRADRSRPRDDAPPVPVAPADRSVQIHACHGPARQVEVLRDVIVGLLADDPTLEPRDVLIMCPDVEAFAPHIDAAFGAGEATAHTHPGHRLRVRLADRSAASVNPVADALQRVVAIAAAGRGTATEVRDLLALEPVRRRFALSDDDLEELDGWIQATGVRWGLDPSARARWGLAGLEANAWPGALDRLALGVATGPDDGPRPGDVLPVDDLSSTQIPLVGRAIEAVTRLTEVVRRAGGRHDVGHWCDLLDHAVDALTDSAPEESWHGDQVHRLIGDLRTDAAAAGTSGELGVVEIAAVLEDLLAPRPTRSNFRTGSLTVCTMVPMRSVPHRVICLLGLDADAFPRTPTPLGDDVLARRPRIGERDAAAEDRQLFCDAVLSATQTLVLTYTGASEHSGRALPAATPVGELLDQLERTTGDPGVRRHVVTRHPLQSFDERSFVPGALVPGRSFSFDPAGEAGARAARRPPVPAPPFLSGAVPARSADVVTLEELRTFVAHPVRSFVRGRLDVQVAREHEPPSDEVPLAIDALTRWQIEDRILHSVLAGTDGFVAEDDERRRGLLPPGPLGHAVLEEIRGRVRPLVLLAQPLQQGAARTVDVDVELTDGRRVVGTVGGVHPDHVLEVTASTLAGRRLAVPWVDVLALAARGAASARPGRLVGRVRGGGWSSSPGVLTVRPPEPREALRHLADLLDLVERSSTRPPALPLKTSEILARSLRRTTEANAERLAERAWVGNPMKGVDGEDADAYHELVFGRRAPFSAILAAGLTEQSTRLWHPLLDHLDQEGR